MGTDKRTGGAAKTDKWATVAVIAGLCLGLVPIGLMAWVMVHFVVKYW